MVMPRIQLAAGASPLTDIAVDFRVHDQYTADNVAHKLVKQHLDEGTLTLYGCGVLLSHPKWSFLAKRLDRS